MRVRSYIKGLKNSQRVQVVVNGVGWRTTVGELDNMVFGVQRNAVEIALNRIGAEKLAGFSTTLRMYGTDMQRFTEPVPVEVSILLL